MTKQSLQQPNCEVQIYRFGKKKSEKKITELKICNLWLFLKYCLNKKFTIEEKRKTLMIMTNLLYGTLMEKPNYYEIQCECEQAYINSYNNKTFQS